MHPYNITSFRYRVMRSRVNRKRKLQLVAWVGLAALAVQSLLLFGHHHDHFRDRGAAFFNERKQVLQVAWRFKATHSGHQHKRQDSHIVDHRRCSHQNKEHPDQDHEGDCSTCLSVRTLDIGAIADLAAPPTRIDRPAYRVSEHSLVAPIRRPSTAKRPRAPPESRYGSPASNLLHAHRIQLT